MVCGVAGSIASAPTLRSPRPVLTAVQLAPPFVVLKTPPAVPTNAFCALVGSTAMARSVELEMPALIGSQVAPPSVVLNTPPPPDGVDSEAAYTVPETVGATATASMVWPSMPLLILVQLA